MSIKLPSALALTAVALFAPTAFPSSLQDWEFNINGTDYFPGAPSNSTLASVPGLTTSTVGGTTTYTVTFNPGSAGTFYVGAFIYQPAGIPFYNELGAKTGAATTGEQWQIDVPEYDVYDTAPGGNHGQGTIVDNLASETLNDTNSVPGSLTNYLNDCGVNGGGAVNTACNDFVSMAIGYKFTLTSSQEEIITFTTSSSNPGTPLVLDDIHPVDGSNSTALNSYLGATASTTSACTVNCGPPPPTSPEPASLGLFGMAGSVLGFMLLRRRARRS